MFDYRNTSFEIRDGKPTLAILPIASIEQHGPHLPVATDLIIMEAIASRVAEGVEGSSFRLPVFPYGTSLSHAQFAGTLWLSADTLLSVVRDVVESLYDHGATKVVVINNHGDANGTRVVPRGNFVVKTAVRQLNYDHQDRDVIWVQPFAAAQQQLVDIFGPVGDELHAGNIETSLLLHLRDDLVKGSGEGFVGTAGREYLDFVPFASLAPGGVWGHPEGASADKGARALDALVEATLAYINQTFAQLDEAQAPRRAFV